MRYKSAKGFSLIELMIVVAIIGVLATIATTSYQNSVRKARRGDAKAALMELAQLMERNRTEAHVFNQDINGANIVLGTNLGFNTSPNTGSAVYYDLTLPTVTSFTFTLQATPRAPQDKDTLCDNLTLTHTGVKGASTGNDAECWSR